VDDVSLPRVVHLAFVRSVHAHARLASVEVDAARPLTPERVLRAFGTVR